MFTKKTEKPLTSKEALFIDKAISTMVVDKVAHPVLKALFSSVRSVLVMIDGNAEYQEYTGKFLTYIKENWDGV